MAKRFNELDEAKYVKHLSDDVSRISGTGGIIDFGGGLRVFVGPMEAKKLQEVKNELISAFNDAESRRFLLP
ncbi:hypothetical protein AGMMS49546_28210 [Spirochaetia bacterium]|nr:hypothetical protein AGMMS49546_28210 [Spirochaetia bacterium]